MNRTPPREAGEGRKNFFKNRLDNPCSVCYYI